MCYYIVVLHFITIEHISDVIALFPTKICKAYDLKVAPEFTCMRCQELDTLISNAAPIENKLRLPLLLHLTSSENMKIMIRLLS